MKVLPLFLLCLPLVVLAESEPILLPGDNHLAVFRYDPNNTYTILALPGVPTDIQLAPDEKILGMALGDTVQWVTEELPGHLFVKPIRPDLFTAGTLVTDRRVYQLAFRSGSAQGRWFQKVSWNYPVPLAAAPTAAPVGKGLHEPSPAELSPARLDPARLNFAYDIEGEGDFRPVAVFDDGRFTWLQFRSPQALPALFLVDEAGPQLVNYVIQGDCFVVQRLLPQALLKLGGQEVRVINRRYDGRRHAFREGKP